MPSVYVSCVAGMGRPPIKVYVVEDSAIARSILSQILDTPPEIEVVGSASNGVTALAEIPQLRPDVICSDLKMPRMDGLELTQKLLATFPCPILILSEAVQPDATDTIHQLLEAGALAVLAKPPAALRADYEHLSQTLINQLKLLAGVTVLTKKQRRRPGSPTTPLSASAVSQKQSVSPPPSLGPSRRHYTIVAIGASTGGPQAVHQVLKALPSDYPLPIVCTQHISQGFLPGLVEWQNTHCNLQVKIAEAWETPLGGQVYYAPDGVHLVLDALGRFAFSHAPPFGKHRPSISTMFEAIAQFHGRQAVGVLLTGMGEDGAQGLQLIDQAGGLTIAQDEATSIVFGMPKVAMELGATQYMLPPPRIAALLRTLLPTKISSH